MFDGTTVTMPDTPANQEAYPQVYNQRPGASENQIYVGDTPVSNAGLRWPLTPL